MRLVYFAVYPILIKAQEPISRHSESELCVPSRSAILPLGVQPNNHHDHTNSNRTSGYDTGKQWHLCSSTRTTGIDTVTPKQPGTWTNCTAYFDVNFGRSCQSVLDYFGLTIAQFSTWNPEVGAQCENLWENYSYCVSLTLTLDQAAGVGQTGGGGGGGVTSTPTTTPTPTSSSSTTTSTSTGAAIPSPTQANSIVSNCNKYKIAADGDYCYIFAQNNGITVDQLATWNTVLGAAGANCGTQFWLGYYYCVGVA